MNEKCQILSSASDKSKRERGGSREILSSERAMAIWLFSFGLSRCGASPGVGSPNVVNYNDGVSNVTSS